MAQFFAGVSLIPLAADARVENARAFAREFHGDKQGAGGRGYDEGKLARENKVACITATFFPVTLSFFGVTKLLATGDCGGYSAKFNRRAAAKPVTRRALN